MSILAIGAHPDDIEIGCGGTLLKLMSQGQKVTFLIVTDGRAGSINEIDQSLVQRRKTEAINSAKVLEVENIHFFELTDGLTHFKREDKVKMIKLIRELKPEIVFIHSNDDQFSDHKIVKNLVLDSIQMAEGPWYAETGNPPHIIKKVYGYEVWNPINQFQIAVDITNYLPKKLDSLTKHESQIESIDYINGVKGLSMYRGAMSGVGKYAEVFEVIKIVNI